MSTNSECHIKEAKPGEWWYILEDYNAPKNAWDWREYATAYGPFVSEDEAYQHLSDHHANPGGYCTIPYKEGREPDAVEQKLFNEAREKGNKGMGAIRHVFFRL